MARRRSSRSRRRTKKSILDGLKAVRRLVEKQRPTTSFSGAKFAPKQVASRASQAREARTERLAPILPRRALSPAGFAKEIPRIGFRPAVTALDPLSPAIGATIKGARERQPISKFPSLIGKGIKGEFKGGEDLSAGTQLTKSLGLKGLPALGVGLGAELVIPGFGGDIKKLGGLPKRPAKELPELSKSIQKFLPKKGDLDAGEELGSIISPEALQILQRPDLEDINKILQEPKQVPEALAKTSKKLRDIFSFDGIIPREEGAKAVRAVDSKVNLIDWVRTPDRVLSKIGLGKEAELLRKKHEDYLAEIPSQIETVTGWFNRVRHIPDSEKRIFRELDGQKVKDLSDVEKEVVGEIRGFLANWADRLGLPKEKRVANYITRLFEKDFIEKEFDPEIAKIIADKVPGSVYNPFLQRRLGKLGYKENVWEALDAYVKRGTRKVHMDEALGPLQKAGEKLDLNSWKYVKSLGDRINLRPTDIDIYLDNLIKQSPIGYKFGVRPTALLTRKVRQMIYRGTLGLNVGSALKNLTQGVNTYAKLGEKYTSIGYIKASRELLTGGDELARVGVLNDNFIQDRALSSSKKLLEKADKGLFTFFDLAEKINRGSAYFGAKARALAKGSSEEDAIKAGVEMAADTQFRFGIIDTPVALQGDLVKLGTQFQSFNVKQSEFLGELLKDKDIKGMIRWAGATYLVAATVGKAFNYDFKDAIPFEGAVSGRSKIGQTPATQLIGGVTKAALKVPDRFGNVPEGNLGQRLIGSEDLKRVLPAFIPGGVQARKTIKGLKAGTQGFSETRTGRVRFPIQEKDRLRTSILGEFSAPEAREFFDKDQLPLGTSQSATFKGLEEPQRTEFIQDVMNVRNIKKGNFEDLTGDDFTGEIDVSKTKGGNIGKDAQEIMKSLKDKGLIADEFVFNKVVEQVDKYKTEKTKEHGATSINFLNDSLEIGLINKQQYDRIVRGLTLSKTAEERVLR